VENLGNPGGTERGGAGAGTATAAHTAQKIIKDGLSPSFLIGWETLKRTGGKEKAGNRADFFQ